jgi:predicted esterase
MTLLKILFLHGYTYSGPIFSAQTELLQNAVLKSFPSADFHFPTAPNSLKPENLPNPPLGDEKDRSSYYGWWLHSSFKSELGGFAEGLESIISYMATHGPFTGIIGFSQGAVLAAIVAAIMEHKQLSQWNKYQHPKLRFVVCYSGNLLPGDEYKRFYETKVTTPVLHVLGTSDKVVPAFRSLELAESCEGADKNGWIIRHSGGHLVPMDIEILEALVCFVKACVQEVEVDREEAKQN